MDEVYRLAKPRKKGILRLVFSRFFLILLLLAAQILITISLYAWLSELFTYFSVFIALYVASVGIRCKKINIYRHNDVIFVNDVKNEEKLKKYLKCCRRRDIIIKQSRETAAKSE